RAAYRSSPVRSLRGGQGTAGGAGAGRRGRMPGMSAMSTLATTEAEGAASAQPAAVPERLRVLLVTGLSGAGRTTALKLLEDMGYEAVDNLPLSLVGGLASGSGPRRPLAIGFDSRSRDFAEGAVLERIEPVMHHPDLDVRLMFLTCSDEVLRRRFNET